jgi:ubiquinone/menaquinone biosynthesis C-methylase UbiE
MTLANWLRKIRTFLPQEIPGPVAVLYEKVAAPGLSRFYRQVAAEIESSLTSGRVLDVGTGPGHLLVEVARHNPSLKLVGLDLSRKMLKIAQTLVEQNGKACANGATPAPESTAFGTNLDSKFIRLVRGDVRNLPFPDGMFELVVSTLSIHHWRDPAKGIQECLRVTAPGGRCWIYDLRTDVPVSVLAGLVTGKGLACSALSWIFKFHGVDPRQYQASMVASWLGRGATVRTEQHAAYVKLNIGKSPYELQDKTIYSKSATSVSSGAPPM